MFAEEHLARINAEGQAADAQRRLQVAQEQIAEFAYEREREATQLAEDCSAVLSALPPEAQSEFISGFQARSSRASVMNEGSQWEILVPGKTVWTPSRYLGFIIKRLHWNASTKRFTSPCILSSHELCMELTIFTLVQKLQKKLAHSAAEAAAFSAMQKADVERTKRSASQVGLSLNIL